MKTRRWADSLSPKQREILQAGLGVRPPKGAKQAVWSALMHELPLAAASASATTGLSLLSIAKPAALGFLLGSITVAGVSAVREESAPSPAPKASAVFGRSRSLPVRASGSASALSTAPNVPAAPPPVVPLAAPRKPAPAAPPAAPPAIDRAHTLASTPSAPATGTLALPLEDAPPGEEDATLVESRRLIAARGWLRAGRARDALRELERIGREFPHGALAQEREALTIEALGVLGEHEAARARARRFIERHPASPHAAAAFRALRD